MYLSFYRNIKFETILNLCYIRPGMATKSWWNCTRLSYFKQAAQLQFIWFTQ